MEMTKLYHFPILEGTDKKITMEIPKLPITFTGTGDLFSSMFLSWMYKTNGKLKESLEKTIASLQAVIKRTANSLEGKFKIFKLQKMLIRETFISGRESTCRNVELKLIQSKCDIENPDVQIHAIVVD